MSGWLWHWVWPVPCCLVIPVELVLALSVPAVRMVPGEHRGTRDQKPTRSLLAVLKIGGISARLDSVTFSPFTTVWHCSTCDAVGCMAFSKSSRTVCQTSQGFYRALQCNFHHSSVLQHILIYLRHYFLL